MRTGLLVTKAEYESTRHHPVIIAGRVEFFNTTTVNTDESIRSDTVNDEVDSDVYIAYIIFIYAKKNEGY